MTDSEMLRKIVEKSGLRLKYIAERIGITYQALLKKIKNETEFKASEIQALCEVLNIKQDQKEAIFFARK